MNILGAVRDAARRDAAWWIRAGVGTRYAVGLIAGSLALALKFSFALSGLDTHYLLLLPGVVLGAVLGGFGPGLVATLLIAAVDMLRLDHPAGFDLGNIADDGRLVLFLLDGVLISGIGAALRRTLSDVDEARRAAVAARERSALFQQLTAELAAAARPADIAVTVLRASSPLLRADHCSAWVREGDKVRILAAIGYPQDVLAHFERRDGSQLLPADIVVRSGEELWLADLEAYERAFPGLGAGNNLLRPSAALAAVPLTAGDASIFGALVLGWKSSHTVDEPTRALIRSVARLTAQALERARLYDEQAARVQDLAHREVVREAFMAVLSHELRTPVTTIFGNASIVAKDPSRPDVQGLVSDIAEEAERLWRIVDDLLVLSRAERGTIEVQPEPVLVQRVAEQKLEELSRKYPWVSFQCVADRGLPAALADPTALQQVLHNLLSNAAKYAGGAGPVTLEVSEGIGQLVLAVLDEGPGPGDDPDALFGLFYRDPTTSKLASGTGIGLYVARELVEAMSGTIVARARPDGGACFQFTLPLAMSDDSAVAEAELSVG